jgi:hypothetical protein
MTIIETPNKNNKVIVDVMDWISANQLDIDE